MFCIDVVEIHLANQDVTNLRLLGLIRKGCFFQRYVLVKLATRYRVINERFVR